MTTTSSKAKTLVVDTNAFIKAVRIDTIGEQFFTIPQVISEVRDAKAREFLKNFPFEIQTREPTPAALKAVAAFAKKTGDYAFLSGVDLRVLALVYTLDVESKGSAAHLRTQPPNFSATAAAKDSDKKDEQDEEEEEGEENEEETVDNNNDKENTNSTQPDTNNNLNTNTTQPEEQQQPKPVETKPKNDDDDGWITPDNIGKVRAKRGQFEDDLKAEEVDVGCFTTDFAMQSVLLQMGLKLLSIDGMVIKKIRQFVFKCYSCYKICKDTERKFCPSCGNDTLLRHEASTDSNGNTVYTQAQRLSTRGTIYSIPLPKGGRHSKDLILAEDVYLMKTRFQKKDKELDVFGEEYSFAQGKIGPSHKVVVGYGGKNPNVPKRSIGKKNKPVSAV